MFFCGLVEACHLRSSLLVSHFLVRLVLLSNLKRVVYTADRRPHRPDDVDRCSKTSRRDADDGVLSKKRVADTKASTSSRVARRKCGAFPRHEAEASEQIELPRFRVHCLLVKVLAHQESATE